MSARAVAGLLLALAAGGCGGLPPTHYYLLESRADAVPAARADGLLVGVRPFRVDPPYDQDRIVYRVGADSPEVGFYEYHRWAAPLGRMLPVVVADALAGVPGIASIDPVQPGRRYSAWLRGRVLAFEEVDLPSGERVRVRLELSLVDEAGETLWSERVAGEATARSDTVPNIVERMRAVLEERLAQSRGSLARAIADARRNEPG